MAKPVFVWDGSQWQQVASAVTDLSPYMLIAPSMRSITESGSLVLDDAGKILKANLTTPATLTIPTNGLIDFPVGTTIRVIQVNTEPLTIAGDVGVSVNSLNGFTTAGQWAEITLTQTFVDEWVVSGDVTT